MFAPVEQILTVDPSWLLGLARTLAQGLLWTSFLYVLPGLALLNISYGNSSLTSLERLGLSLGLGICIYPPLYLWADVAGVAAGAWIAWSPGVLALVFWLWQVIDIGQSGSDASFTKRLSARSAPYARRPEQWLPSLALTVLVVLAVSLGRLLPVDSMTAPSWGDSVHHTMIVQLLRENGGLFRSWAPYAPIESFTYHFGFHANMAVWATVTGQAATDAVIHGGQFFNVMAVLAVYPLAVRLGGSRVAGLGAVIVAGLLSQQPGMYVNWGRYTQLAAQVILPAWLWAMDVWWTDSKRPSLRFLLLVALLAAGLGLTHYRVAIVAFCAAAAWALWSLWTLRSSMREWLVRLLGMAGAGVVAVGLILPWVLTVRASRLSYVVGAITQRSAQPVDVRVELDSYRNISTYYARWLWVTSLFALAAALWRRPRLAVPLFIWAVLAFAAANPFLFRVAGTGILTNFLLVIALYIPIALLLGWLLSEAWIRAQGHRAAEIAIGTGVVVASVLGFQRQATIVDPFFAMVTPADTAALSWVDENTSADSRFLVNAFPAYSDTVVVGSDAGWWLPYYTRRASSLPPILYSTERLSPDIERDSLRRIMLGVRDSAGEPAALRAVLCEHGLTHVYLGDKQGQVGFGETQLIPPEWLQQSPDFELLHQTGDAQVWSFDSAGCSTR